jgi:hypothetical protein
MHNLQEENWVLDGGRRWSDIQEAPSRWFIPNTEFLKVANGSATAAMYTQPHLIQVLMEKLQALILEFMADTFIKCQRNQQTKPGW